MDQRDSTTTQRAGVRASRRVGLLVLLLTGCAGGEQSLEVDDAAPAQVIDLLDLPPWERSVQTGRVLLGDDAWWRGRSGGWEPATAGTLGSGRGVLEVTANAPTPEVLSVHTEGSVGELRIWLNEIELGAVPTPGTASIETPRSAWISGDNRLAFERASPDDEGTIVVKALEYGRRRAVQWPAASRPPSSINADGDAPPDPTVSLDPNTYATLAVESAGAVRIVGQFRARGAGLLLATVEQLDPNDGARVELERREVDVFPQSTRSAPEGVPSADVELTLDIEADPAHPRLVTLHWLAEDGDPPLEVLRLDREESLASDRPPVLFISIDTLAARHMSVYGYERETTPNLERFAAECLVFEQARSNAPWTIPSYASQLTGQLPATHFVADLLGNWNAPPYEKYHVAENRWTLAEAVAASGYRTHAIVDNSWMAIVDGMLQGFQSVDLEPSERPLVDSEGGMRLVFPRALEWLDRTSTDALPFFLMLQVLDVHGPYLPIEGFRGAFGSDSRDGRMLPIVDQEPPTYGGIPDSIVPSLGLDPDEHEELPLDPFIAAYDEKILEFDTALGEFLDALRRHPRWDDLLIILSADHGENMAAQEFYFRHGILNEETLHVPLLVRLPQGARAGQRVEEKVDLVSLYPTLLDLLGLDSDRTALHGHSFARALRGEAIAEHPVVAFGSIQNMVSIEVGDWKKLEYEADAASLQTILTSPELLRILLEELPDFETWVGSDDPEAILRQLARPGVVDTLKARAPELEPMIKRFLRDRGKVVRWYDLTRDRAEGAPLQAGPEVIEEQFEATLADLLERVERDRARGTLPGARRTLSEDQRQELITLGYLDADD